jgi:tetratricopeptide (TPR) repeat protein
MTGLREYLYSLQKVDLIALKQGEPELEFAFKHIFTQETIYSSLLNSDRRQIHRQVAEVLEAMVSSQSTPAEKPDDLTPLLAYHFEQSGDRERAIKYLKLAADQARDAYTNQEAKEMYSRALALLEPDDYRRRWEILAAREQILDRLGERERQATDLTLMQTLAELDQNEQHLAYTHNRRAIYFDRISEYQSASEAAAAGRRAAQQAGETRLEAQSLNLLALAAWRRFDYQNVKKWANEALDVLRVVGDPADRIVSLLHLGRASYRLGQYDLALDYNQAAQKLASDTADPENAAVADLVLGWIYQRLGDYDRAQRHFEASLGQRQLIGDRYGEATALSHLGWLAWDQSEYEAGLDYCQKALDISRMIGDRENEAYALSGIALNHQAQGNLETATINYRDALVIQQEIGATTLAIFDQAGLARIALDRQNRNTARKHIEVVVEWILAGNAHRFWDPWVIYKSAYEVLSSLGEMNTAAAILNEAHQVLHQRAAEISNRDLRDCFLNRVAINREIKQAWSELQHPASNPD